MIERAIYSVLAAGRDHVNEDQKFLEDFARTRLKMSEDEISELVTYWKTIEALDSGGQADTGVSIVHQFPRDGTKFPCWSIVLVDDKESKQFLGDEAGIIGDDGEDVLTSIWDSTHAVFTYATNPLICAYYYELCRFFMTRGRPFLKSEAGGYALSTRFSGGDMILDPKLVPASMFVRRFSVDVSQEIQVLGDPQVRATKLRGMFMNSDLEGAQVEGVEGSISTYIEGEESDG